MKVRLVYSRRGRETSERVVDPLGLVDKDDVWYLIAGPRRGSGRTASTGWSSAETTGATFERPDGFELSTAWAEIVERMEERRSGLTATVLMDERFVWVMQDRLGRNCEVGGVDGDGGSG